ARKGSPIKTTIVQANEAAARLLGFTSVDALIAGSRLDGERQGQAAIVVNDSAGRSAPLDRGRERHGARSLQRLRHRRAERRAYRTPERCVPARRGARAYWAGGSVGRRPCARCDLADRRRYQRDGGW